VERGVQDVPGDPPDDGRPWHVDDLQYRGAGDQLVELLLPAAGHWLSGGSHWVVPLHQADGWIDSNV